MKTHTKTALIGVGRWGQHVARELTTISELVGYTSRTDSHKEEVAHIVPSARPMSTNEICVDQTIEAVVIATPIGTHEEIARQCLVAGKHVLVEKPAANHATDAHALNQLARSRGLIFATGYIFLYHPVYVELKRRIAGVPIRSVSCEWKKYGTFAEDIEMNLLTHHLALAYDLLGVPESATLARGGGVESVCDRIEATLRYEDAIFTSSIDRASDQRAHAITVTADNGVLVWNGETLSETRKDSSVVVYTDDRQPLALELKVFLDAVETKDASLLPTAGSFGAHILEIHEMFH